MAQITYTIPDEKLADFKVGFLKMRPVPIGADGEPQMPENEWIKEWGRQQFIGAYKNGKHLIATQQSAIDEDIIG